jgi:bacterioferritin-associated ferredoxin
MIVCSCNVISDHDIRGVVVSAEIELYSTAQVYDCLGCVVQCGLCSRSVRNILDEREVDCPRYARCAENKAATRSCERTTGELLHEG